MEKAMHSVRVADDLWRDEKRFGRLLDMLKEYPGGIGQISFFTAGTHVPLPLDEMARRLDVIKCRMADARQAGFSAGINCLGTIGHHEENLAHSYAQDEGYMVNIEGKSTHGTFCMNGERFLSGYVAPLYRMMAEAAPDYIWVDDDIRFGHMPIGNGCFCDTCIALFNRDTGASYTRETLRGALNAGDIALRKAWLDFNTRTICRLMTTVRHAVDNVNPDITLGFMTGERYLEGYNFAKIAEALSGGGKHEILWRPGGGAYTDIRFDDIVEKSEQIGRQNAYLPEYVTVRQSEIENFPYMMLRKTPTSTALEAAWTMTAGCTGAAFNILPAESGEPVENALEHLKKIDEYRDFYRLLAEKLHGAQPVGIHNGWTIDAQAAVPSGVEFAASYGGMYASYSHELFEFGLPQCYRLDHACVTTMTGQGASVMSDGEIGALLEKGVFLDAGALDCLNGRGFGKDTGFGKGDVVYPDAREQYVGQAYDEPILGGLRNARQAFYPGDSFALLPASKECRTLSRTINYQSEVLAGCCMGLYENARGGRVCASGYYPYTLLSDAYKSAQLKEVMLYLSRGTLPSYVDSWCRVRNHTFVINGTLFIALLNPTNQGLEQVRICARTEKTSARVYALGTDVLSIEAQGRREVEGSVYRCFTVPKIGACEMVLAEIG